MESELDRMDIERDKRILRAARIATGQVVAVDLIAAAAAGRAALAAATGRLTDKQTRSGLELMAQFHTRRQEGAGVKIVVDSEDVDAILQAVPEGFAAVRTVVYALEPFEAKAALANLVWLYRDAKANAINAGMN